MVTFDLGRVTTDLVNFIMNLLDCGDVRSRTSYNITALVVAVVVVDCGDVRSRTSYNFPYCLV